MKRVRLLPLASVAMLSSLLVGNVDSASALPKAFGLAGIAACGVVLGLRVKSGFLRLLAAWTALLLVSFLLSEGRRGAGVTDSVILRAYVGYVFAWTALTVQWGRQNHMAYTLRLLALTPFASVALGILLQVAGRTTVLRFDAGIPRMQGALIPAHLAMLGVVGVAASLYLYLYRQPLAAALLIGNVAIVFATGTRGASAVVVLMVLLCLTQWRRRLTVGHKVAMIVGAFIVAFLFVPALLDRNSVGDFGGAGLINTSGRLRAWEFYWLQAQDSLWTGQGLGASSTLVESLSPTGVQSAFEAPHNTYLQLVVDGGIVGFTLLAFAFRRVIRRAGQNLDVSERRLLGVVTLAVLIYAAVDNVLATPQFTVPFAVLLGTLASIRRDRGPVDATAPAIGSSAR